MGLEKVLQMVNRDTKQDKKKANVSEIVPPRFKGYENPTYFRTVRYYHELVPA